MHRSNLACSVELDVWQHLLQAFGNNVRLSRHLAATVNLVCNVLSKPRAWRVGRMRDVMHFSVGIRHLLIMRKSLTVLDQILEVYIKEYVLIYVSVSISQDRF